MKLEPFLVKSGILGTSVYNVYGSQNEFVERVTRVFILRMGSLGQSRPLSTEHCICGRVNSNAMAAPSRKAVRATQDNFHEIKWVMAISWQLWSLSAELPSSTN